MGVTAGIWRPDQYQGEADITIRVSQLASDGIVTRSEERRIEAEWIDFLARPQPPLRNLTIWSRVKQEILEAVGAQRQLEKLDLKWGTYFDLKPISGLGGLTELVLGGARKVVDLSPLANLTRLRRLVVSEASEVGDLAPLAALTSLTDLTLGNAYLGSDKVVHIRDLDWLEPLVELRHLRFPGTSLAGLDLSPIARLPQLETLDIPARARHRDQVLALAETSPPFRETVETYRWLDSRK